MNCFWQSRSNRFILSLFLLFFFLLQFILHEPLLSLARRHDYKTVFFHYFCLEPSPNLGCCGHGGRLWLWWWWYAAVVTTRIITQLKAPAFGDGSWRQSHAHVQARPATTVLSAARRIWVQLVHTHVRGTRKWAMQEIATIIPVRDIQTTKKPFESKTFWDIIQTWRESVNENDKNII